MDLSFRMHPPSRSAVADRRAHGLPTLSDAEMFEAFDIEYSYDLWSMWQAVVVGREPVGRYVERLRWPDATLLGNHAKLRLAESPSRALAWTALMAFCRGPFMIYAGQESAATAWPELFERAPINWATFSLPPLLRTLAGLTKHRAARECESWILDDGPHVHAAWALPADDQLAPVGASGLYGIFDVAERAGPARVQRPDGEYRDIISGSAVQVRGGAVDLPGAAVVLEFTEPFARTLWRTPLLDVFLAVEELGD